MNLKLWKATEAAMIREQTEEAVHFGFIRPACLIGGAVMLLGTPFLAFAVKDLQNPYRTMLDCASLLLIGLGAFVSGAAVVAQNDLRWKERVLYFLGWQAMLFGLFLAEMLAINLVALLRGGS